MSKIKLRSLFSDAVTLSIHDLGTILSVSPCLQYVDIETRGWQRDQYDEFSDFLAHGRHVCDGHDDPLGACEKWHEDFSYVVSRKGGNYGDGEFENVVRNENGLERNCEATKRY